MRMRLSKQPFSDLPFDSSQSKKQIDLVDLAGGQGVHMSEHGTLAMRNSQLQVLQRSTGSRDQETRRGPEIHG